MDIHREDLNLDSQRHTTESGREIAPEDGRQCLLILYLGSPPYGG